MKEALWFISVTAMCLTMSLAIIYTIVATVLMFTSIQEAVKLRMPRDRLNGLPLGQAATVVFPISYAWVYGEILYLYAGIGVTVIFIMAALRMKSMWNSRIPRKPIQ